jgi:hypothetical protein
MRPHNNQVAERSDNRLRVTTPDEAQRLVLSALDALDALEPLIEEETAHFKAGRVRDALDMALDKNTAASRYTLCLEALKSNAIAIGRFQPPEIENLRVRHDAFQRKMALNMAVVATARTVSEGLMRELADSLGQNASPKVYAPRTGITRKAGTTPLAVSRAI